MRPPDAKPALGLGATLLVLAAVAGIDSALLVARTDTIPLTTWWSTVGLVVGLVALSPVRRWPVLLLAIFVTEAAVDLAFGADTQAWLAIAGSHTLQALVGAAILTRLGRRAARLGSLPDLGLLGVAALVGGVVALALETSSRPDGVVTTGEISLLIGSQHVMSIVLFGALMLSPAPRLLQGSTRTQLLLLAQSAALFLVLALVFTPVEAAPLLFVPIPVLVWGAIAFEVRIAVGQLFVLATAVILSTTADRGPFTSNAVPPDLVGTITLAYVASAALVTLPLAVIVTQRRQLTAKVASDEHLFRRTFTESPLGMVLMKDDGGHVVVTETNAAAQRIFEAQAEEIEGRRVVDLIGLIDYRDDPFGDLMSRRVDTWHGQATVLGRPGSRVDLAIAAITGSRSTQVFSAQLLDRTQEQDSRQRLEDAHKLTDATLDTAACIILVTDESGTIVRINAATKELTGYGEDALLGRLLWESPLAALTRSETEAMFVWPNRSGFSMARERLSYTASGDPIRLVWNNNVVRSEVDAPAYAVLTGVDVTSERSSTGLIAHLLQASIATALIGMDVSGRITVINAGAAHMLGSTPEELIGQPFVSILDPSQLLVRTGAVGEREAFLCLVGMIGTGEESATRDWAWRTRDGHELIVSMTLSVTDDDVEDRVGFLCVGRDVTEQREGQDTLVAALDKERTAVERLRSLDRAKDEFVSTVSHELRTPVTSILGYAELLLDGDVVAPDPKQVGMLETISRNSHRLIAICNDLLMLSGFESRDTLANRETYDLREAVTVAEDFARAVCAQRPLTITFSTPETPVMVSGDRGQLDRVFVNLVSNAIKFTDDGGTVDIVLSVDDTLGAVVTVGDSGMGIHKDDHELVFQRFYRTDDAHNLAIPGTGLGLSIVAGIIDAHGGSIDLDSAIGEGTTFTVRLPVVA